MKWVLVLAFGLLWGAAGFVGGAAVAVKMGWGQRAAGPAETPPAETVPAVPARASASPSPSVAAEVPDDRTPEEKIRWKKLRKQIDGFWVFAYKKPGAPRPYPRDAWKVYRPYVTGSPFAPSMPYMTDAGYVSLPLDEAEETARRYASSQHCDCTAVLDFRGEDFPRVVSVYIDDGNKVRRQDKLPTAEAARGLNAFLLHLR